MRGMRGIDERYRCLLARRYPMRSGYWCYTHPHRRNKNAQRTTGEIQPDRCSSNSN